MAKDFSGIAQKVKQDAQRYVRECNEMARAIRNLPSGEDREVKTRAILPKIKELYRDGAVSDITDPLTKFEVYPGATQIRLSIERGLLEGKKVLWGALRDAGLLSMATNSRACNSSNPIVRRAMNACRTAQNVDSEEMMRAACKNECGKARSILDDWRGHAKAMADSGSKKFAKALPEFKKAFSALESAMMSVGAL